MNKLIDTLANANNLSLNFDNFKQLIDSVIDVNVDENNNPVSLTIGINGNIIIFETEDINFINVSGDALYFSQILDVIKAFKEIVPHFSDEDIDDPDYEIPLPDFTHFVTFPEQLPITIGGTIPPLDPVDGHQWYEANVSVPLPWQWSQSNNIWVSNIDILDFTFPHIALGTNTALRLDLGLPSGYNKKLWLEELNFTVSARNAAFTATEFWTFSFQWYDNINTNAHSTEYSINTQNMTQSTIRTGYQSFKKIITPTDSNRNIVALSLLGSKTGTGTALPLPSLRISVRYIRP